MTALEFLARNGLAVFKVADTHYTLHKLPFAVPSAPLAALAYNSHFNTPEEAAQAAAKELGFAALTECVKVKNPEGIAEWLKAMKNYMDEMKRDYPEQFTVIADYVAGIDPRPDLTQALSPEQEIAVMEGEEIASENGYFDARPGLPEAHRRTFAAGFVRGWEARK